MNPPTIILTVLVAAIFLAIVLRGILRRKHHGGGGCGCGCSGCPSSGFCHPSASEQPK